METVVDEETQQKYRKAVSRWKFCWKCMSKQLFIKHDKCGVWHCTKHDIKEFDDDAGYPHWAYPVCPNCGEAMRQFKALYTLFKYEGVSTINNDLVTRNAPYKIGNFYMTGVPKDAR